MAGTSCFSDDVVEKIISFLPPRDMATLSIISRRFRYSWKLCRDLSFGRSVARNLTQVEYITLVNRFLYEHRPATIDKLCLCFDPRDQTQLVDHWIYRAIQLGVGELELDFTSSFFFSINSTLFAMGKIKALNLINCDLNMPIPSNHLKNLKDLKIQKTQISQITIDSVLRNCPVLRKLELVKCKSIFTLAVYAHDLEYFKTLVIRNCANIRGIRIASPTLSNLHYQGKLCEISFHSILQFLTDVILNITHPRRFKLFFHKHDDVIALQNVTTLTVTSIFHEGLCPRFVGNQFRELEFSLMNLKEFQLIVMGESNLTPLDVARFLRRCPRIEKIFIDLKLNSFGDSVYWNYHGRTDLIHSSASFPYLQYVKIKCFTYKELPLTMARVFLSFGRFLQVLVIVKARNYNSTVILTPEHIRLEIPTNARIEIYEYRRDKSNLISKHSEHVK